MKTDIDTQMNEDVVEKIDVKRMSLSKRFIGSLIDKILIVAIFTVGYVIAKPYGGPGLLGKYIVMQKISPRKYTMIDLAELQKKGKHSTNIRVPDAYRRLAEMEKPRYIGATNDLDIQLSTIFIIVNIIYYLLFELFIHASIGKRIAGGVLYRYDELADAEDAILRAFVGAVLMLLFLIPVHFVLGVCNVLVIVLFFLAMDIPLFFNKRSLLDIITRTQYVEKIGLV